MVNKTEIYSDRKDFAGNNLEPNDHFNHRQKRQKERKQGEDQPIQREGRGGEIGPLPSSRGGP